MRVVLVLLALAAGFVLSRGVPLPGPEPPAGGESARVERAAEARSPKPPANARGARVERVVDGDTVVLSGVGKARLIGVDTPEAFRGVECFGREASAFAKRVLGGKSVKVAWQVERRDRYGRELVDVWLSDGRFFNAMLVARGYAQPLTIAPNVEYAKLFVRLSRQARSARRGLWGRAGCTRS